MTDKKRQRNKKMFDYKKPFKYVCNKVEYPAKYIGTRQDGNHVIEYLRDGKWLISSYYFGEDGRVAGENAGSLVWNGFYLKQVTLVARPLTLSEFLALGNWRLMEIVSTTGVITRINHIRMYRDNEKIFALVLHNSIDVNERQLFDKGYRYRFAGETGDPDYRHFRVEELI